MDKTSGSGDAVWRREAIESPCVQICMLHPETKLCIGCARTGDEIARWTRMSAEERRAVMAELPGRQAGPATRRGGRRRTDGRRHAPADAPASTVPE
ncbi:MAG: DUF1289 domain-containing protein [Pseudomonadota bacterium]